MIQIEFGVYGEGQTRQIFTVSLQNTYSPTFQLFFLRCSKFDKACGPFVFFYYYMVVYSDPNN